MGRLVLAIVAMIGLSVCPGMAQPASGAAPGSAAPPGAEANPAASAGAPVGSEQKNEAADSQPDASSKTKPADSGGEAAAGTAAKSDDSNDKAKSGVKLTLQEQSEGWANLVGGGRQGTSYVGLTTATLDLDLEKSVGLKGGRFYASVFDIHGHGPSRSLVGNNQLVSSIEATPSLKLYDLWVEQHLSDSFDLRLGQEGANDELMISTNASLFLNSSFGFPGLASADLPSGGPNYPLATPFVRARWKASDKVEVVGAVFNGDPAPPGPGDPEIRDRNGTAFRLDDHALSFAELRYSPDGASDNALATTYKLGAWYHSARFADRRFDISGGLLANPLSSGVPRPHIGDYAFYGIVDQVIWREPNDDKRGIALFLQVQAGPADRNLSDLFVDGGMNWKGPFMKRPDDVAGIALAYLGISPAARRFSRDLIAFGRAAVPFASNETIIEATYKAPITGWLTLQPDVQYVINPNAHMPGPFGARPLPNALVIGLRATIGLGTE